MSEERKSRYELFLEKEARKAQPTKRCRKCKTEKVLGEFRKKKCNKDGFESRCKTCMSNRKYKSPKDRFWKSFWGKVRKNGDCLEWTGAYGGERKNRPVCGYQGKLLNVRHVVYSLAIGEVPEGMSVVTSCHNSKCVRHAHLLLATQEEVIARLANSAPCGARNVAVKHPERFQGEKNGNAKLTENDIRSIRSSYIPRVVTCAMLAGRYGVDPSLIGLIVRRKNWKHVA